MIINKFGKAAGMWLTHSASLSHFLYNFKRNFFTKEGNFHTYHSLEYLLIFMQNRHLQFEYLL